MRNLTLMLSLLLVAVSAHAAAPAAPAAAPTAPAASAKPWCAIQPSAIIYNAGKEPFVLYVVIRNGNKAPLDATKLKLGMKINGTPMANWGTIMSAGAEPAWKNVPQGKYLQFGVNLTQQLKNGPMTFKMTGDCETNEVHLFVSK